MKFIISPLIKFGTTAFAIGLFLIAGNAFAASTSDIPSSFSFQKTLYPNNSYDPDVKYLQLILNSDSQTEVSATGPGSNDNPTIYYRSKTKDAVNRFQTLYKEEILTPAGLSSPTGIVGQNTRIKLNSILSGLMAGTNSPISSPASSLIPSPQSGSNQSSGFRFVITAENEVTDATGASSATTVQISNNSSSSSTVPDAEFAPVEIPDITSQNTQTGQSTSQSNTSQTSNTSQSSGNTNQNASSSNQSSNQSNNQSGSNSNTGASTGAAAGAAAGAASGAASAGVSGTTGGKQDFFGGTISNVTYCTCSASVMLDINDYRIGYVSVVYTPGISRLYANYNVFTPGPYVIGGYTQGTGQCLVYSGTQCNPQGAPFGTIDSIRGVGSSGL